MNFLKLFYLLILSKIIISSPIELDKFSDIELTKGISEYHYSYLNNNIEDLCYFFIKINDYKKIELKIYLDEIEEYFHSRNKEQWIMTPFPKKKAVNVTIKVNTKESNLRMIFFENSEFINISAIKFFNLNLKGFKSRNKLPVLRFNLNVDTNIFFSLKQQEEKESKFD